MFPLRRKMAGLGGICFLGRHHQQSGVRGNLLLGIWRNSMSSVSRAVQRGVGTALPAPSLAELADPAVSELGRCSLGDAGAGEWSGMCA